MLCFVGRTGNGDMGLTDSDSNGSSSPSVEQCQVQLQRMLSSKAFRNADTLQHLLHFLATKAIEGHSEPPKEYTIGIEVFGRKSNFDPKTDTIVRVQMHRLREKLREYYETEGAHDSIFAEIPKGCYVLRFQILTLPVSHRLSLVTAEVDAETVAEQGDKGSDSNRKGSSAPVRSFLLRPLGLTLATMAVFAVGAFVGRNQARIGTGPGSESSRAGALVGKQPDPVTSFWGGFLGDDRAPILAYPNAVFLLDDSNDLLRYRRGAIDNRGAPVDPHLAHQFASNPGLASSAGQLYYENGYTGTGELVSVAMLSGLFARMGAELTVKSSQDVTPEDLKQHNVILLGSSFQNAAVAQFFTEGDFSFENPDARLEQWRGKIVNAHPRTNESAVYQTERDPVTRVLKSDYSLVSMQPGIVPGRNILIVGGLDTKGTEGATLFLTSQSGIEDLFRILGTSDPFGAKPAHGFQALVRVHLERGYQVLGADLVTVHVPQSKDSQVAGSTTPTGAH